MWRSIVWQMKRQQTRSNSLGTKVFVVIYTNFRCLPTFSCRKFLPRLFVQTLKLSRITQNELSAKTSFPFADGQINRFICFSRTKNYKRINYVINFPSPLQRIFPCNCCVSCKLKETPNHYRRCNFLKIMLINHRLLPEFMEPINQRLLHLLAA